MTPGLDGHRWTLDTGRHELAVWDWGEGPTVLLSHGWGGQAADFRHLVGPLVKAGFSVVAFDHPAHGQSSGQEATLVEFARALEAVGRRVGPLEAIVGHSFGGAATALALDWGLPAKRAVLIAAPMDVRYFARGFADAVGLPERAHPRWYQAIEKKVGVSMDSLDVRELARRQRAEALVVHDEADREVPFEHGQAIAAAWPNATLQRVAGLGHRRILADAGVAELIVRTLRADLEQKARLRLA